jgi:transcriptional regulator with XRE-family HTH domain
MAVRRQSKKYKPDPKNGNYYVALMVAGNPRLAESYRRDLRARGILLKYHWPNRLHAQEAPADTDLIFMAQDTRNEIPRKERERFAWTARQQDIYVVEKVSHHTDLFRLLDREKYHAAPIVVDDGPAPEPVVAPEATPPQEAIAPPPPPPQPPEPKEELSAEQQSEALRIAGGWVREARMKEGLSTSALAKSLGISSAYVNAIERGTQRPSDAICDAIESVLSLPAHSYPRFAKRTNHQYQPPPDVGAKPARPPEPKIAPPETIAPTPRDIPRPIVSMDVREVSPIQQLYLVLSKIKGDMGALGITRIELSPTMFVVETASP